MRKLSVIFAIILSVFVLSACEQQQESSMEQKGQETQDRVMDRAMASVPTPQINHFLTRKDVAKWMKRMDKPNKVFYVYLLADNGNTIGYYVASSRPVSVCTFLTPTKRQWNLTDIPGTGTSEERPTLGPAPGLDGVYRSGGSCDGIFFFDAATDAYIEVSRNIDRFVSDQPLSLDADPIEVVVEE